MNDDITKELLTSEEQLQAILYQFINLYERWSEDRQVAAKQGADIAKFVKEFAEQVKLFSNLEEGVRKRLYDSIAYASSEMAKTVGKSVSDAATKEIETTIRNLKSEVEQANRVLKAYREQDMTGAWKVILGGLVGSIGTALIIVWLLMPKPMLPLTEDQMAIYGQGLFMQNLWPKLSKSEQKRLQDIGEGKITTKTSKLQKLRAENPNLSNDELEQLAQENGVN